MVHFSLFSVQFQALPVWHDLPLMVPVLLISDEQYRLYLDGKPVGRGSDSGSLSHWYLDSWQVELTPERMN